MAGINVNQITSTLARLSPEQLQAFAQANKGSAVLLPLAVEESNRRKKIYAAQQAAQGGMQPQPKVAEAAIAQMAPQEPVMMMAEGGIAALSAPNMQQMADGGIAGYDGYDEGGMTYGQDPVMMMAEGGVARYNGSQSQFVQDLAGIPRAYEKWWQRNREEDAAKAAKEQEMAQRRQETLAARQKTSFANYLFGSPEREAEGQAELAELATPTAEPKRDEYSSGMDRRIAAGSMPKIPSISGDVEKPKDKDSGKGAGKGKANIKPAPTPVAAAAAADPSKEGIAALFKASTAAELGAEAEALSKKDIARMEKEYSPFLEELKAEKEALGKRKDSNAAEALVRAGLSIAGGKSRNALENIAAGAKEGFNAFTEANKADDAARRALRQSEMSIMQAQRAERSGYHKDAIALSNQARQERQFAISSAQQAEQIKNTKAYQEGSLANQRIVAEASRQRAANAGGGMSKEAKLRLEQLKAYAANLKSDPMYQAAAKQAMMPGKIGADAKAAVKQYEAKLAQVNAAIAQAAGLDTMVEASPASAGSGIDLSQWGKSQVVKP
jgi:hypothetical protein